jgi:hypothetical protein
MMFTLQAPYPQLQTTTLLPSPQYGDAENQRLRVTRKYALDGTRYVYVKRKGGNRLQWQFKLTRNKSLELRAFIQSYFASVIRITDDSGRHWVGHFLNDPFEFTTSESARPAIAPMPRGELVSVSLEFEGTEMLGGA